MQISCRGSKLATKSMETMSFPCSPIIPSSTQFEDSSNSFLLWPPQVTAPDPHENATIYEFDQADYSHDQIQHHELLDDMIMTVQEAAKDLLHLQDDDFPFSNADIPLAISDDERLAVEGQEKNGNLVVAIQEELSAGDFLLAGAMAVEAGDAVHFSSTMSKLDNLLFGKGSSEASPIDHLACYFARALHLRIAGAATPAPAANRWSAYHQMLQELTPFTKFAQFTANQAILESATADDDVIHVVDFNVVGDGVQWSSLMSDLAGRRRKPLFHLTAVTTNSVTAAQRWLSEFAESLGLPFNYTPLHIHHDGDGDDDVVHELAVICKGISSPVIISCDTTTTNTPALHGRLHRLLLGCVRILHPNLVILIGDELTRIAAAAAAPFSEFFSESLDHFTAVMESMASCFMGYDEGWLRIVEEEVVGPRVEETVGQYGSLAGGARDAGAGAGWCQMEELIRACEISSFSVAQAKMLVGLFSRGFGVLHHGKGRLALCWKSRPLTSVSVWCSK